MFRTKAQLYLALGQVLGALGNDGGLISPSVYDTAQVLRFCPPRQGVASTLAWLCTQQQADGGWGDPAVPLARDIPTLAAVLALTQYQGQFDARANVARGVEFLRGNSKHWARAHIDLLPIAAEMILPRLLADAAAAGIVLDRAPYAEVHALSARKLAALRHVEIVAGSAPTYSWEALDRPFDPAVLEHQGGVGHSPAATAYWLHLAHGDGADVAEGAITAAATYLERAAAATGTGIPGVVPTVWPIIGFDHLYAAYACVQNGLHRDPEMARLMEPSLEAIGGWLARYDGLGFSPGFVNDVDCTAVGVVALAEFGRTVDSALITAFRRGDHFFTYARELNPSTFSNAHAISALHQLGVAQPAVVKFILEAELADGGWRPDKWHSSWIYTSMEVSYALQGPAFAPHLRRLVDRLLATRHVDGGWPCPGLPSLLDSCYAVMTLRLADEHGVLFPDERGQLCGAENWLIQHADLAMLERECLWMGKELYSPRRVDQVYVLSTLWAVADAPTQLR